MVESVRAQTMPDWELIVVDDGSTEDIQGLLTAFDDPRLVYVRFPENKGIPHGLNYALSIASGDYVQPLSADEFLWERKLEVQVAWMDEHPGIGATWGLPTPNVGAAWELGEAPEWQQYQTGAHNRSREAWIRTLLRLEQIPIGGAALLMRRECYQAIGGFDPQFFDVSDLEWYVRFFQKYQGWILPYRLADAVHPAERLSGPSPERNGRFQDNMKRLHDKHKLVLPPVAGRVTVGIPVRNMEKYVGEAIQSILDQTFADFDLVLLDDASTDGTVAAIQRFSDPRITLLQFDENRGVPTAQNHMLACCDTDFFMVFAADDRLDPTFLERCLAEFARDPFLEFVTTQTDFMAEDGGPLGADHIFPHIIKAANKSRAAWLQQLYYGNHYFGCGMYRTQPLKDLGGWDPEAGVIADYAMYVGLLQRENLHVIEENLTHTRVHDAQQSMLKGKPAEMKLRVQYHNVRSRYYPPRMKVVIATPFYEMKGFSPYITALVHTVKILTQLGIEHEYWELSGDSYVDRAKNTLFNKFLEDPAATDLFVIDSDMAWDPVSFVAMLKLPEEIVMGSYPQKNQWETWTARPLLETGEDGKTHPVGRMLSDGSALIKAEYLAGGYLRVKRAVLEKYKEHYKDHVYHDMGADPAYPERLYTEFFTCERGLLNGVPLRWGEDRVFGRRMAELGVEAWIYPNAQIGHYGVKGWHGNYDKFLRRDPQKDAA